MVFAKRLEKPQVFGKNHTCKVFTKHFLRLKSCHFQYLAEVGKAAMLKEKFNHNAIESTNGRRYILYMCECVMGGGGVYKLGELQKIWNNAVYIIQGDFCKIRVPIWNFLIFNICGYFHTCLVFPTRVW